MTAPGAGRTAVVTGAARGIGFTKRQILVHVQLPCALPLLISGIRSSTLQIVSTATIAAYLGLQGLGRFILDGRAQANFSEMAGGAILVALVAAVGGTILQIVGPDRLKTLTNEIMKGLPALVNGKPVLGTIDMSVISTIAISLAILYGFSFLLNLVQSQIMATVTQRISKRMRTDISQKVNRLPLKYFDSTSYGNVLSHVTNDVDAIGQTLSQSLGTLITAMSNPARSAGSSVGR